MRVLVSGSSGLIGAALIPALAAAGHEPVRLVRHDPARLDVAWNPNSATAASVLKAGLERLAPEAIVHLAGDPIAAGRWTAARKRRIVESRVRDTRILAETLASLPVRPRVFISASAIGWYGARGDEALTEDSASGNGFLPELCRAWEESATPAAAAGIRTVNLRIGIVLSPRGGALGSMLPIFRCGLGGRIGSGRQYMSWIAIADMIAVIIAALERTELTGPVNAVSPYAVTNAEFTRTLARVLHRPAWLFSPAWALKLMLGEIAEALLLSGVRVVPSRLKKSGFVFRYPVLEDALRNLLKCA